MPRIRKPFQFGLASLLILIAASAIVFAYLASSENLEYSLRRDLDIAKTSQVEIIKHGVGKSRYHQVEERFAWVLVNTGKRFELIGAKRPVDESLPWEVPVFMISWIEGESGADPYYFVFSKRPAKSEIESWIRYSEDF